MINNTIPLLFIGFYNETEWLDVVRWDGIWMRYDMLIRHVYVHIALLLFTLLSQYLLNIHPLETRGLILLSGPIVLWVLLALRKWIIFWRLSLSNILRPSWTSTIYACSSIRSLLIRSNSRRHESQTPSWSVLYLLALLIECLLLQLSLLPLIVLPPVVSDLDLGIHHNLIPHAPKEIPEIIEPTFHELLHHFLPNYVTSDVLLDVHSCHVPHLLLHYGQ